MGKKSNASQNTEKKDLELLQDGDIDDIDTSGIILSEFSPATVPDKIELPKKIATKQNQEREQNPEVQSKNIPNTYGDLFDTPDQWLNLTGEEEEKVEINYVPMDEEINSIDDLPHGDMEYAANMEEILAEIYQNIKKGVENVPLEAKITVDTLQLTLSSYIQKMPHGIVDKQIAGIGATTLEINSKRNSIIVVPTKILAYNKYVKHKDKTLYVGGKVNREHSATSDKEIISYLKDENIKPKKFLVVADSLARLLKIIGKEQSKDYFLMIDEVDMIQSESNYRPKLESLIDYYFQFSPKNRCLVTATLREFSNPLLRQECKFKLTWKNKPQRDIKQYYTDDLDALTAQQVQSIPQTDKIVIAFNSIRHCLNIIKMLSEEAQKECAILCSDSSKEEAGDYYAELTNTNHLPQRINFLTSCYFAGVDIEDSYHLITVSNAHQNYQMLSLDKLTQIYGRCRIAKGILSDTIIANSRDDRQTNANKSDEATLLKQVDAILQLQKAASELGSKDADLADLFKVVKTAIREKAAVKLPREEPVKLTRENIYGESVPAYMNIDYLVERQKLCNTIYNSSRSLSLALKKQGHTVSYEYKPMSSTATQAESELSYDKEARDIIDTQLQKAIEEIREIAKQKAGLSKDNLAEYLTQKSCKSYVQRLYKLRELADAETLIDKLWEIRHSDKRAYNNLQNAAVFWALDDKHPFKRDLFRTFKIGRKYKTSEIHELLAPLVKYHLHKTIKQRAAVSLLKALFLIERPKTYLIKGKNPMGFKKHGSLKIPRTEENLLKYFQI